MKKRLLIAIIVIFSIMSLYAATTPTTAVPKEVALRTYFTHSSSCFSGLSKNPVISTQPLNSLDIYDSSTPIVCTFIYDTNKYESIVLYVYCQSFSSKSITVKLSAPVVMTNTKQEPLDPEVDGPKEIPYKFITPKGEDDLDWIKSGSNFVLTSKKDENTSAPRVVISHPIKVQLDSSDVWFGQQYSMTMTMEVSEQ